MPKRYKRSRKYGKRRRRYKKRSGRRSLGFKIALQAAKTTNRVRTYYKEERDAAVEAPQNQKRFQTLSGLGEFSQLSAIINFENGGVHTDLGANEAGNLTFALGTGEMYEQQKWDFSKYKKVYHFRNIDEHECFFTIYEIVAKTSRSLVNSNMCEDVLDTIYNGFIEMTGDPVDTSTSITGDSIHTLSGSTTLDTYSGGIKPTKSRRFRNQYKIVKAKKFKLNPGDDVFWKMSVPDRVFNPMKWLAHDATTELYDVKRNYSKCLLVELNGVIGRDQTAGQAGKIGFMQADVSYDSVTTAAIVPMHVDRAEFAQTVAIDDLTGVTLVGPGEEDLKD